jgi:hypothetical protein
MMVLRYRGYSLDNDGIVRYIGRVYVPPNEKLRNLILNEAHRVVYMAHPRVKKMKADLKPLLFWKGMKYDIVNYMVRCLQCQQDKDEHIHPTRLLQPHVIPKSKWEVISMDFIVGFPLMVRRHDSIFVVFDMLMKIVNFILFRMTYQEPDITTFFVNKIVRLHCVMRKIISDRGSVFTRRFWTSFQEALGTQINFNTTYHTERDGKTKRMNKILEYML